MLYISAQPAEYYFLWQLEIQLQNFEEMGILSQNIHVLLSYKPKVGIPVFFEEFTQHNKQAQFFFYSDQRVNPKYLSSIRPHILKQHFDKYPELETKTICYHDSDIIFRERLDEVALSKGDYWFFSDTRNYVAASYLKRFGNEFFRGLCKAVEIDPLLVEENESYSGGAQHVMKGVTASYWKQVEEDAERIYTFIKDHNAKLERSQKQAQAWCADMWAILGCAWKMNKEIRLHDDLLFSWPKDHISRYGQLKIFHNSGVFVEDKKDFFCKLLYKKSTPYDVDFSSVKQDYCSVRFVEKIQELALMQRKKIVQDCTLVIGFDEKSIDSQQRITQYVHYIFKYLNISVHLVEQSHYSSFDIKSVSTKAKYYLYPKDDMGRYIKEKVKTAYFIYTDANILLPIENILKTIELLQSSKKSFVYPMNEILEISQFQYDTFKDTLTIENWTRKNISSVVPNKKLEFFEAFSMSKREFVKSGGNNLDWCFFYEDGFNLENQARYRFLGYDIQKVREPAYKLFSKENIKNNEQKNSHEKYLKLCNGTTGDLKRKLAQKIFSYRIPFSKKTDLSKQRIGICKIRNEVQIVEQFQLDKYIEVKIDQYNSAINNLHDFVRSAQYQKVDFLILFDESIEINDENNLHHFWKAISEMNGYGIQVLSAINSGVFKEERKLSQEIFWIEVLPSSCILVLHHSIYESILEAKIEQNISIEAFLDKLTTHKGTITPFLGFPITLNTTDEKSILAHKDRIDYIKRIEDKLIWIRDNEELT